MSTLTLSGWTQPVDALMHLAEDAVTFDYSDYPSPEASFVGLGKFSEVERIIAWSMGGQLALRAMAAGVLKPKHLTLIAPPAQFVTADGLKGMDPLTFEQFRTNYAGDPARTKERFHGLIAKGDADFKRVKEMLGYHPQVEDTARWLPWLDDLAAYRLPPASLANLPPTLIIHGMNDVIVPHAQSLHLAQMSPQVTLRSWDTVGHAPHLHDASRVMAEIAAHRAAHGVA